MNQKKIEESYQELAHDGTEIMQSLEWADVLVRY